jgi:predicted nucleic acid-binding protein
MPPDLGPATPGQEVIVDASILAALVFGEPRAVEAAGLLKGRTLVAPTLLRHEIGNVARTKIMRHADKADGIRSAFAAFLLLPLRFVPLQAEKALEVALAEEISFYDAAYLEPARRLRLGLLTFDARLARAFASAPEGTGTR